MLHFLVRTEPYFTIPAYSQSTPNFGTSKKDYFVSCMEVQEDIKIKFFTNELYWKVLLPIASFENRNSVCNSI
jgi:hypothetical protein